MENINLTSSTHPKAPAIIKLWDKLVSASDYWSEATRKLLWMKWFLNDSIDKIMAARTLAKLWHSYKKEVTRRTGERYFDHATWVALILLLELWETDADILAAAEIHDVLEDVEINPEEMKNLITRSTWEESYRIAHMVTNPKKTWNKEKDKQHKIRHYHLISLDEKSARLKVADRMYNLRCLEIFHLSDSEITEKHFETAKKQIEETREFILPTAIKYWIWDKLLEDVEKLEKRVREVSLILAQRNTKKAVENIW